MKPNYRTAACAQRLSLAKRRASALMVSSYLRRLSGDVPLDLVAITEEIYGLLAAIFRPPQSLEAHTGRKLFDRRTRKMVPTAHGRVLYNAITEGITKLEEAEQRFSHQTKAARTSLSLGRCFEYFQLVLEPYISALPFDLVSKFRHHTKIA